MFEIIHSGLVHILILTLAALVFTLVFYEVIRNWREKRSLKQIDAILDKLPSNVRYRKPARQTDDS